MIRSSFILVSLVLAGCGASINYCGRGCSPKGVQRGTGASDAEGGPLVASCPVGFTCDAVSSTCVANDGHCTGGSGTTGAASTGGTGGSSSGSTGGSTGG